MGWSAMEECGWNGVNGMATTWERESTHIKLRRNNKSELTIRPKFTYTGISTHRETNANVNSMLNALKLFV